MSYNIASTHPPLHLAPAAPRPDWLPAALTSGFVATAAAMAALAATLGGAHALGVPIQLHDVTRVMTAGATLLIAWSIAYSRWLAPRPDGRGWARGAAFSLLPWCATVGALLPLAGISVLDAGPVPALTALLVHLVHGAVLGATIGLDDRQQRASRDANAAAERGAGIGMVLGAVVGYGGGWMIAPSLDRLAVAPAVALAFALAAAAVGMLVGSLLGLGRSADRP